AHQRADPLGKAEEPEDRDDRDRQTNDRQERPQRPCDQVQRSETPHKSTSCRGADPSGDVERPPRDRQVVSALSPLGHAYILPSTSSGSYWASQKKRQKRCLERTGVGPTRHLIWED